MKTKIEAGWKVYCNKSGAYCQDVIVWVDDEIHAFAYCECSNSFWGKFIGSDVVTRSCNSPTVLCGYRIVVMPELKTAWLFVPDNIADQEDIYETDLIEEERK